ncbi:hypothetical protein C0991_010920 [Blastosporella zonata]|nr:hypothetical protein C0991_010920 [Blastosporella zonata]
MLALMYRRFFQDLISRHREVEVAQVVDYVEEVDVVTSLDIIENTVPAVIPTPHLTPHLIITGVVFFMTLKLRGSLKMDTKIGQISPSTNESRDEEATAEKPSQVAVKSVVVRVLGSSIDEGMLITITETACSARPHGRIRLSNSKAQATERSHG